MGRGIEEMREEQGRGVGEDREGGEGKGRGREGGRRKERERREEGWNGMKGEKEA